MNNWAKYAGGGVILTAGVLFIGRNWIMSYLGYGGVSITRQVLEDQDVHETAKNTVLSLADKLIKDPKTRSQTNHLIKQTTEDESVKENIKSLVKRLVEDEQTLKFSTDFIIGITNKQETKDAISKFMIDTLEKPETREAVTTFFINVVSQDSVIAILKAKLVELVRMISHDDALTGELREYFIKMFDDDTIRELITRTGTIVLTTQELEDAGVKYLVDTANNPSVKSQIETLLTGTINNEQIQGELHGMIIRALQSEALRASGAGALSSIVKQSLTPSWWTKGTNSEDTNLDDSEY